MHPIHPMVVHFPIALLIVSVIFDLLALQWPSKSFREASLYALIVGLLGAILAIVTGSMAEDHAVKAGAPKTVVETHEQLAYAASVLFAAILVMKLLIRSGRLRELPALSLTVGLVGLVVLSAAGYFGGSLVYEFGGGFMGSKAVLVP
ncbi:MAG: DUF2231 domain-containing protein [Nitrospirae bacterium]|nr:MAG: DUF2231 domain-containing protein [Nitrospirota bacterium]